MVTDNLTPPDRKPEEPDLQPPDETYVAPGKRNLLFILLVAFTLFVLLDIAIIAYFFFVHRIEKSHPPVQQQGQFVESNEPFVKEKSASELSADDSRTLGVVKEKHKRWLKLQAMAEADDIRTWAETDFTLISEKAGEGERFLAEEKYQQADERFQQVASELEALLAARPALLAKALERGKEALAAENSAAAVEAFTRALALSPENFHAKRGLARAQGLEQVLALYKKGLALEEEGEFTAAEDWLGGASKLDPDFLPAAQALARVRARLEEADFQQAMGTFLQALAEKKVERAKDELNRAAGLRPQSPIVLEGKKQLQQLVLQQTLDRLQQEYKHFAASEQWQPAQERCAQALKIDSQAVFALAGLQTATRRLELDQALQGILDSPLRLQEPGPLQEARQTLAAAESVTDPGPRLSQQLAAVKKELAAATRQVLVVLQSDNTTEVVIYRVGRLGRFNRRELHLRPGRYTAIGSRPGYRDVRKVFVVQADAEQASLRIRCEEVI